MEGFEYRLAKQNSHCRGCDKINKRGEDKIIYTYSMRNRGQNIIFCKDCVEKMFNLIKED